MKHNELNASSYCINVLLNKLDRMNEFQFEEYGLLSLKRREIQRMADVSEGHIASIFREEE
jgi:hypothetical protein